MRNDVLHGGKCDITAAIRQAGRDFRMNATSTYDDVVAGFYRAGAGDEEWPTALKRLSTHLDLLGSQFVCVDHATGALTHSQACATLPAEGEIDYVRNFFTVDPRIPLLLAREPGRWLYCQDEFPAAQSESQPFYRDLLIPYGGRHSASMKAAQTEHETVLFASLTRLERGRLDEAQKSALDRLSPHLVQSIGLYRRTRRLERTASVGAELIERVGRPVFVLSMDRHVEAANGAARKALETPGAPLRIAGSRLHATSAAIERQLTTEMMVLERGLGPRDSDRFIRLEGIDDAWLAISLALVDPQKTMHTFSAREAFLLTLHPREPAKAPDPWMLQSALGLTAAEARVAVEIYGGATLREAAARIGIRESTAKTHLKSIFARQRLEKQTDLVRLIGNLVR